MLHTEHCCLVVIDIQGKLAQLMHQKEALFKSLSILIQGAKILHIPVLWCQQVPDTLGPTVDCVRELLTDETPINKSSFSCWPNDQFQQRFAAINPSQAILCGIETHICVWQTACDLHRQGIHTEVVVDAVSSRTLENKNLALEKMRQVGIGLTGVEMALFELLGTADHTSFRQTAKLIK
jgi:nicotinamidase-related amidase